MSGTSTLLILSLILVAGAVSKVIGDRYKVPSIIFLLSFGIVFGPSGLEIINSSTFEGSISSIVGFAVAIIVFEGAFHLDINRIKRSRTSTSRIVTIGAIIAFIGTAIPIHFIMGVSIEISFLIASLLIATGPTVITPIMEVVDVRPPVETTMETEGITNDVTAAILAVVIFEAIIVPDKIGIQKFLIEFGERIGIGIGIGLIGAYILYKITQFVDGQKNSIQDIEILVVVSTVLIFSTANTLATESGVAAVAIAGLVLGNIGFTFKHEVQEFADEITPVVLSVVFIILAALVEIQTIIDILWYEGLIVVLLIIFVVRPLLVFVSTFGGLFTTREKLFISFVGPRGIIPASVASLFAIDLRNMGMVAEADILVSTVFLVIFATVFVEGGPARYIAQKLQINPMKIIVIGGGDSGKELVDRLSDQREEAVTIVESDVDRVDELRNQGYSVVHGDGRDSDSLKDAGIESTVILAAMTGDDDSNMLSTQLARNKFDVNTVVSKVDNDENKEAFESLGVKVVSDSESTAIEADNIIDRPAFTEWVDNLNSDGMVVDIEMNNEEYAGVSNEKFTEELPDETLIVLIKREDTTIIPDNDTQLKSGDQLTFVTRQEFAGDIRFLCRGEND